MTKHLAANAIEPKSATPKRQSKIDPLAEKLAGWLMTEAGKSRKQRRTMMQLHAVEPMPKLDRVILDVLGNLPFSASGGALLFRLLSKLCEHTRLVITPNRSFSE